MRIFCLSLFILIPFLACAEYNGVHVSFKLKLKDETEILGYKYIAHKLANEETQVELESNTEMLLRNDYTFEPGEYGCYLKRLEYAYHESVLYKLLDPVAINLEEIASIEITDMVMQSYTIQIANDLDWDDRIWMKSPAFLVSSESQDMCTYDIFFHRDGEVPENIIIELKQIIERAKLQIHSKEKELSLLIKSDNEHQSYIQSIYDERNEALRAVYDKCAQVKIVIVGMCTC